MLSSQKKRFGAFVAAILLLSTALAGCRDGDGGQSSQPPAEPSPPVESMPAESEPAVESVPVEPEVSVDQILENIRGAYGEDYLPNSEVPLEILEAEFGLTPDLYDEAKGEMSMITAHPDVVVVVKSSPGMGDDVEMALNNAKEQKINNEMQYPMNIPKTNASQVVRRGDYVAYLLLGAPLDDMDADEQAAATHAREQTQIGVDAFERAFGDT